MSTKGLKLEAMSIICQAYLPLSDYKQEFNLLRSDKNNKSTDDDGDSREAVQADDAMDSLNIKVI